MIKGKLLPGLINIVSSTTFLFVFSHVREHTNPTSVMDAKQWVLTLLLFFFFFFLGIAFFICIVPQNTFSIITIIIIMSFFYLLLCYKPISDIRQGERVFPHGIITQISWALKWSRISSSCHESTLTASIHISWVLKRSGIR